MECEICLDSYDLKRKRPRILPCGHTSCESCLVSWFKDNDTCPVCRNIVHNTEIKLFPVNFAILDKGSNGGTAKNEGGGINRTVRKVVRFWTYVFSLVLFICKQCARFCQWVIRTILLCFGFIFTRRQDNNVVVEQPIRDRRYATDRRRHDYPTRRGRRERGRRGQHMEVQSGSIISSNVNLVVLIVAVFALFYWVGTSPPDDIGTPLDGEEEFDSFLNGNTNTIGGTSGSFLDKIRNGSGSHMEPSNSQSQSSPGATYTPPQPQYNRQPVPQPTYQQPQQHYQPPQHHQQQHVSNEYDNGYGKPPQYHQPEAATIPQQQPQYHQQFDSEPQVQASTYHYQEPEPQVHYEPPKEEPRQLMEVRLGSSPIRYAVTSECNDLQRQGKVTRTLWKKGLRQMANGEPSYYEHLGEALLRAGLDLDQLSGSVPFDKALPLQNIAEDPGVDHDRQAKARVVRAFLYKSRGYMGEALQEADKAAAENTADARIFTFKGALQLHFDQDSDARESFHAAVSLGPRKSVIDAMYGLGKVYGRKQDKEWQQRSYMQYVNYLQNSPLCAKYVPDAAFILAKAEIKQKMGPHKALEFLKHISKKNPEVATKSATWFRQGLAALKARGDTGHTMKASAEKLMLVLLKFKAVPEDFFLQSNEWQD